MDMDITLIVKASNQQFEDQTIKCEPSWTIRRLKGHLADHHPGKPSTDEQKLIYSGQLLSDSVVLKDILRHYDGQKTHTVHLVFTPKNNRFQKDFSYASGSSSTSSSSNKNMSPKVNETTVTAGSGGSSSAMPAGSDIGADGLRQRNVGHNGSGTVTAASVATGCPPTPATNNFMEHHLAMQNLMQQAYMQYLNQYMSVISGQTNAQALYASAPTNLPASPATATVQPSVQTSQPATPPQPIVAQTLPNLAYYPYLPTMNSPMPPMASSIPAPITSSGTIPTSSSASVAAAPPAVAGPSSSQSPTGAPQLASPLSASSPAGPSAAPQVAAPQPGASATDGPQTGQTAAPQVDNTNAAQAPGAAGGAAAAAAPAAARRFPNIVVEEQENRDWLDIFFSLCRVGILMTVVYLYSSPVRCLTVLFIGIALYLYQIGFFRTNDPMERARRIVVQEINNAHGIRQNAALRARVARQVAAAAAVGGAAVAAPAGQQADAAEPNAATPADETVADQTDSAKAAAATPEGENNAVESTADGETAPLVDAGADPDQQIVEGQSNAVPEANRVNLNDVAGFLRTLVLSFFTSIIPDTPAA